MGAREGMNPHLSYRKAFRCFLSGVLFLPCLGWGFARAQEPPTPAAPNTNKPDSASEISQSDTAATFKVRVNLVQVRVIVRDPSGKTVDNLAKQDFVLYDQGKPQYISNFSVETPQSWLQRAASAAKAQDDGGVEGMAGKVPALPERFVAVVFDDLHLSLQDATFVRQQAGRFLDSIGPTDRVGIYSTSGQNTLEFTADKDHLHRAILGVIPHPLTGQPIGTECPQVTYYMADQIENKNDSQALAVVVEETVQCAFNGNEAQRSQAVPIAQSATLRALSQGDIENQYGYRHLEDALRRLAAMPGERIMLFVSPGFALANSYIDESGIIDRANRSNIVMHTIDARGLYVPDVQDDISRPVSDFPRTAGYKTLYRVTSQFENQFVLGDLAYGTGGTFFHNSNDLQSAFQIAGLAPDVSYVLAFSPQNRKMDGRYHQLSVKLEKKSNYSVQARRGYYAPRKAEDPRELARQEIQEAIFSQEEISDLPLDLHT